MKRITLLRTLVFAVVAGAISCSPPSRSQADEIELRRLLHGPQRCDHVIGLLLRHGVNNDSNPAIALNTFRPLGPIAIPVAELGDLELVSVAHHAEIVAGCGPAFDLVIKNCSTRDVCGSRITMVGLFGRICPTSPNVTVKIDLIPAGQTVLVCVTLPIESLAMGNLNGQMIGFNRVLVVVDSFDQFMESNEANNLRVFDTASIPVATVAVEVTESVGVVSGIATGVAAVIESAAVVAAPAVTADPVVADPVASPEMTIAPAVTQPAAPEATSNLSEPDLQSAINQFTDQATAEQEAS